MPVLREARHSRKHQALMASPSGLRLLSMILFFFSTTGVHAQTPIAKEYQVKALFLYNFTQFVQWPAEAFARPDAPLVIGILGEDPFGSYIDKLVEGEIVNNRAIVVQRYATIEEVGDCHMLFINFAEKNKVRRTLDLLQTKPVLTVADADNFARMGGMIRFSREDERIGLRINASAVKEAQLVISSKLLRLSDIVSDKNN